MNTNMSTTMNPPRAGMFPVGRAMTTDFLIRAQVLIYEPLLIPILPLIIYMILDRFNPISHQEIRFIFFMGLLVETLLCTFSLGAYQSAVRIPTMKGGFPRRLFTLPVSTPRLVFWHMTPGFAFILLSHLILVFCVKSLTGAMAPYWPPVLYLAAMYAWTLAVLWALSEFVFWKYIAMVVLAGTLGSWMMHFYVPGHLTGTQDVWRTPSAASLATLAMAIMVAFGVALYGVHRDRSGEARRLQGFDALWNGLMERIPERKRSFASPREAQLWLEMRQKGLMPIVTAALLIGMAGVWFVTWLKGLNTNGLFEFYVGFTFLGNIFMSVPLGPAIGHLNHSPQRGEIDLFRATRPLSDRALAFTTLRCGWVSILVSWLVGMVGMAVIYLWLLSHGQAWAMTASYHSVVSAVGLKGMGLWAVPLLYLGALLTAWTLLGMLSLLTMSGRGLLFSVILMLMVATFFVTTFAMALLELAQKTNVFAVWEAISGGACLLGTLWGFFSAARHRLIGPVLAWSGYGWVLLVSVISARYFRSESCICQLFAAGLFCLPAAPLALAPLALAWNRHR